jgi:hypothetical protein
VLASSETFAYRPDSASTVGAALLAASSGLGHRRVAERVGLPPTTVRGWLRRARANADRMWSHVMRWVHELDPAFDPMRAPFTGTTESLAALVDAVGYAAASWVRRRGPIDQPWKLLVALTSGALLAPPPQVRRLRHPLDTS